MHVPRDMIDSSSMTSCRGHVPQSRDDSRAGMGTGVHPGMPRLREMPANLLKKPLDRDMARPGEPMVVNKIGGRGHEGDKGEPES